MDCSFLCTAWAKAVIVLVLIAASSQGAFVSRKAPKAIISSYDEVYPVVVGSSDDKPHPSQLTVEIKTRGAENFTLVLSLNRGLFPPTFKSIHYNQNGQEVISENPVNCFYHGFVVNHPKWTATMSTCQGMSGSFGDPSLMDQLHHVEPLTSERALHSRHAYYTGGQLGSSEGTCGTTHNTNQNITKVYNSIDKKAFRSKVPRQTANGELILEWILVSDYRQYQAFNSNVATVVMRALQIANLVDSLWKPLGIRVVLIQTITWSNGDMISVVSDSSTLLSSFQTYQSTISTSRDGIMLLTGITLNNNIVGLAYVGTMCGSSATAETQDGGRTLEATASTAAHELGHNLNMAHDDDPSRNYTCNCTDSTTKNKCIMASVLSNPSPTHWSDCSSKDLMTGLNPTTKNLGRCLTNNPAMTVGSPVCGNGIQEGTEICDCGSVVECKDPCCNATSCQLKTEAQCGSGACCQSCKFKPQGTTCRNATNECDLLEYCSGSSSQCPADLYRQNGKSCASGQGYCYNGMCPTLDNQCNYFYGQSNGNINSCYNSNTRGDYFGHCGVTAVGYIPCNASNIGCGCLFCNATQSAITNGPSHVSIPVQWAYTPTCISFTLTSVTKAANPNYTNPGFVADGTKCSAQSLCIQQQCVTVSSLSVTPCPAGTNGTECSGHGACNNLGTCSCDAMYTGAACSSLYSAQNSTTTAASSSTKVSSPTASSSTLVPSTTVSSSTKVSSSTTSAYTLVSSTIASSSTKVSFPTTFPSTLVSSTTASFSTKVSSTTSSIPTKVSSSTTSPSTILVPSTTASSSTKVSSTTASSSTKVSSTTASSSTKVSSTTASSSTLVSSTTASLLPKVSTSIFSLPTNVSSLIASPSTMVSSPSQVNSGTILLGAVVGGALLGAVTIVMILIIVAIVILRSRQKSSASNTQQALDHDAGIEMGPAGTKVSSELQSNARRPPPPPPARRDAPPPYPGNGNGTHSDTHAASSRPPPPSRKAPICPKPVPAPRTEVEVDFKAGKPSTTSWK
ncbi:hypothetical protein EMCRGX_G029261 [Ephydatia muelleri]